MSTVLRRIFLLMGVFCIGTAALAGDYKWLGGDPNSPTLWNVPVNWDIGSLPTSIDRARFLGAADFAEVVAGDDFTIDKLQMCWGPDNAHVKIHAGASLTTGLVQVALYGKTASAVGLLEIDGGTMQSSQVRLCRYADVGVVPYNEGTILINSGTYTVTGTVDLGEGPHNSVYYPGIARLIMNGGTMTVGGNLEAADDLVGTVTAVETLVDLNDGVLEVAGWNNDFRVKTNKTIDIDFGTWIIDGDATADIAQFITDNQLIGFGGAGTVVYDYGVTNLGKTTVTALHPLNPSPENKGIALTGGATGSVALGWDNYIDPNHTGATVTATVWFGTDPNKLGSNYSKIVDGQVVTPGTRSVSPAQAIVADTTYYWQVDFDNGSGSLIEGPVFEFLAIDNDQPTVTVQNVAAWLVPENTPGGVFVTTADTFSSVVDDTAGRTYAWTINPAGDPNVVFSSTTVENPTITVDAIGTWTLTLTVDDGYWTESASGQLTVSANACEAARLMPDYAGDLAGDVTNDCVADIQDLAIVLGTWLDSSRATGTVLY